MFATHLHTSGDTVWKALPEYRQSGGAFTGLYIHGSVFYCPGYGVANIDIN